MAVLIEGISVVVRLDRLEPVMPGGFEQFAEMAPNRTLCADTEIARVGFMTPDDVRAFCEQLSTLGLVFAAEDPDGDFAVVDQQQGPTTVAPWLEFGRITLSGSEQQVAACRLRGSAIDTLATPESWAYEGSLSQRFGFVSTGNEERLRFLRRENGVDVYLDRWTGEEAFVARTRSDRQ